MNTLNNSAGRDWAWGGNGKAKEMGKRVQGAPEVPPHPITSQWGPFLASPPSVITVFRLGAEVNDHTAATTAGGLMTPRPAAREVG